VSAVRSDTTETAPLALSDGFTVLEDQDFVSSESVLIGFAYLQQTTAASANPTWSNLSGNTGAVICTYKAL